MTRAGRRAAALRPKRRTQISPLGRGSSGSPAAHLALHSRRVGGRPSTCGPSRGQSGGHRRRGDEREASAWITIHYRGCEQCALLPHRARARSCGISAGGGRPVRSQHQRAPRPDGDIQAGHAAPSRRPHRATSIAGITLCDGGGSGRTLAEPPFGTPRTMIVQLVADIQNRLFWRVGTGRAFECCVPSAGWSQASPERGLPGRYATVRCPLARSLPRSHAAALPHPVAAPAPQQARENRRPSAFRPSMQSWRLIAGESA